MRGRTPHPAVLDTTTVPSRRLSGLWNMILTAGVLFWVKGEFCRRPPLTSGQRSAANSVPSLSCPRHGSLLWHLILPSVINANLKSFFPYYFPS